jgi:hypothetical protein
MTAGPSPHLEWEGMFNVRDLGGHSPSWTSATTSSGCPCAAGPTRSASTGRRSRAGPSGSQVGKDRTGLVAALILSALGVRSENVAAD